MISKSGTEAKIVGIELLRFISALSVLIWHYQHFAFDRGRITIDRAAQPFYSFLKLFYEHGALGVQMFWCISGFIFFFKYFEQIADGRATFREFVINRFSRLYPLHLLTLLLVAALQPVYESLNGEFFVYPYNDLKHFVLNLLFISQWGLQDGHSFNAPIWSVSIELIVYLAFFELISRFSVIGAYSAAAGLYVIFRLINADLFAQCLMYFFIGGALALGRFVPGVIRAGSCTVSAPFKMLGFLLAMVSFALAVCWALDLTRLMRPSLIQPVLITSVLYVFVAANSIFVPLAAGLTFLGNLTYASYLCHFPIQMAIMLVLPLVGWTVNYHQPWLLMSFLLITFTVAAFAFRQIEMPSQRYLRSRLRR